MELSPSHDRLRQDLMAMTQGLAGWAESGRENGLIQGRVVWRVIEHMSVLSSMYLGTSSVQGWRPCAGV